MLNLGALTNKFSNITYISQKISIRAVITAMVLIFSGSIGMRAIAKQHLHHY